MSKLNTENKVKSQQRLVRETQIQNHQEIVFGDSKFIFYDSNISEPVLKKFKSDNRTSIYRRIGVNKATTISSRPNTTIAKQRSKMMAWRQKNKENSLKSKDSCRINLVFNENLPVQNKDSEIPQEIQLKNSPRLSKTISNQRQPRMSKKNKTQIPNLNLNSPDKSSKFKSSLTLQKSRQKNLQTQRTHSKGKESPIKNKVVEDKSSLPQNSKVEDSSQKMKETEIVDVSEQQNQVPPSKIKHDEIKQIFGGHHKFLKTDRDYLFLKNEDSMYLSKNQQLKIISRTSQKMQKKLQKQISELNLRSNSPNYSKQQNNSICQSPKSLLNTNSFIAQTGIYRAPILLYLKNSETKKLYNIIIQNAQNQNENYIDKEFSHEGITTIDEEVVEWLYIQPSFQVKVFPLDDEHRLFCSQEENLTRAQSLEFISFLKCLYYVEPELIRRLFEPPVNNLYSVWLFLNGCYEPVFVDGYFPLDCHLNHFYGSTGQFLWLPILTKCICKIKNELTKQKLNRIKLSEIYNMLTGMPLQIIQNQQLSNLSSAQLSKLIWKQTENGCNCMLYFHKSHSIWLAFSQNSFNVTLLNTSTGQRQPLESMDGKNFSILVIPEFVNQFIYNFRANQSSLSKFQVICPRSTEVTFSVGGVRSQKVKNRRLYIYQCEEFGRNHGKVKLILREETEIKNTKKLKFKKGNYKVFIQDGEKKIHLLLTGKNIVKWQQKSSISSQFCISLFATHEIKLSQLQQLQKKGNYLEDSSNIYQDCPNRRSQQHP